MFIDAPNWAEIKSADATYQAMIAAWWAAITTTLATFFAAVAVWWARKAAIEASKQANAANAQTALLERQLAFSEPKPIVILSIAYKRGRDNNKDLPIIMLQNLGESIAFDVEVSEFVVTVRTPEKMERKFNFQPEFILMPGKRTELRRYGLRHSYPEDIEWLENLILWVQQTISKAMEGHDFESVREVGSPPERIIGEGYGSMTVSFRNSRGKIFRNHFHLDTMNKPLRLDPIQSLVQQEEDGK
jgi:hypothetical protein